MMMTTEHPIELIQVPLGSAAHNYARQFAAEQRTVNHGKRVYLNTLAVYALYSYLQWIGIEAQLEQSQSWHPGLRSILDTADLMIPGQGRLECRPVASEDTACFIPPEALMDRIGYVAVQFDDALTEAALVGFAVNVPDVEALPLSHFQPLEDLIDHLESLEFLVESVASNSKIALQPIPLRQWLAGTITTGWQVFMSWMELEPEVQFAYALRSQHCAPATSGSKTETNPSSDHEESVFGLIQLLQSSATEDARCFAARMLGRVGQGDSNAIAALTDLLNVLQDDSDLRWWAALSLGQLDPKNSHSAIAQNRQIDLGLDLAGQPLNLIIAIMPENETEISIWVQVRPTPPKTTLAQGLELSIRDALGVIPEQCQAIAREADNLIALRFTAENHERFSVQLAFQDAVYTEEFIA